MIFSIIAIMTSIVFVLFINLLVQNTNIYHRFHPGWQRIYLYDGQYSFSEPFFTYVKKRVDGTVDNTAYRYTYYKLGHVIIDLNSDRAHYCGRYKWRKA